MEVSWLTLLRAVHISAGAVWFGTIVFATFFLGPTVRAAGESGSGFMAAVNARGGLGRFMTPFAITALASGLVLYWRYGYLARPFASLSSTLLTLGGLLALGAWIIALATNGPLQRKLVALAREPGATTPERAAQMQRLQARMATSGRIFGGAIMAAFGLMVLRSVVG